MLFFLKMKNIECMNSTGQVAIFPSQVHVYLLLLNKSLTTSQNFKEIN